MVADGWSNKEIAERLGISVSGVKKHLDSLMTRYGVRRRTMLVRRALESGETRSEE